MSLWSDYRRSLKSPDVEEPIDLWVHRPLAFVLARALLPTPVSPDFVTLLSIVFGVAAGGCIYASFHGHFQVAGLLIFASIVFDCADGQLARMRGTSSVIGRMLDGSADLLTTLATAPATLWVIARMYAGDGHPPWLPYLVGAIGVFAMVTSSFHTSLYDHYKNVYLRFTGTSGDNDDYEAAAARYATTGGMPARPIARLVVPIYLMYLKGQRDQVHAYDPYTSTRITLFPAFEASRGELFRAACLPTLRVWRGLFGFGSLMFGIAVSLILERPDLYLAFRLLVLNGIFYGWLRSAQRRASRAAFERMGLTLPDQPQAATAEARS